MLIRFVTDAPDEDSCEPKGLFLAASWVRDHSHASQAELDRLADLRQWFNDHLNRPKRLTRSARPHCKNKAISWFKDSATEHLRRAREMTRIIEANGLRIHEVRSERPGYVVYEDEFQVVAEPFSDTFQFRKSQPRS